MKEEEGGGMAVPILADLVTWSTRIFLLWRGSPSLAVCDSRSSRADRFLASSVSLSRPGSIDRQWEGKRIEEKRGEGSRRNSPRFFSATDSSVQGSRLFQRDCSVLLLRSAHAPHAHTHARVYNTYVTHTHARAYTRHRTRRETREDASCALTLAVDERRPRWIKKERVGEGK